jgi:hypothetical protein
MLMNLQLTELAVQLKAGKSEKLLSALKDALGNPGRLCRRQTPQHGRAPPLRPIAKMIFEGHGLTVRKSCGKLRQGRNLSPLGVDGYVYTKHNLVRGVLCSRDVDQGCSAN